MLKTFELKMNDWIYNAGIIGLMNVLDYGSKDYSTKGDVGYVSLEALDGFEENYFEYFIKNYEKSLSWNKIVLYSEIINFHEENDFEKFKEEDLDKLNEYIRKVLKYYTKSASYKSAYKLLDIEEDILSMCNNIEPLGKIKKGETVDEKMEDVKKSFTDIKAIISRFKERELKKHIAGKNIIYGPIKNAWDGISFLNPQTKEKNNYVDYKQYFLEPAIEYLGQNNEKFKYNCFCCNRKMKDLKNDLGFLNNMGFDVNKKSSHVWNFNNDVSICPICKLIYSCVPAGITYVYDRGIYINDNQNLNSSIRINNRLKSEISMEQEINKILSYRALVNALQESHNESIKYELSDVQLVRYEDTIYKFNMLSKRSLRVIYNSKEDLNQIVKCSYKENNTYFSVYELVVDRLLNNQNLFNLIQRLFVQKLSKSKDSYYSIFHIKRIIYINMQYLKEVGVMGDVEKSLIDQSNSSGYFLRKRYREKNSADKLTGVSYKLLNALKTSNKDSFMDTVLNCHMYAKAPISKVFLKALESEDVFKTVGYAFVAGLIEGESENRKGEENND